VLFFFSSRRRHTRLVSDWSSDVCSSDLPGGNRCEWTSMITDDPPSVGQEVGDDARVLGRVLAEHEVAAAVAPDHRARVRDHRERSEERRVGEEGRERGGGRSEEEEREEV